MTTQHPDMPATARPTGERTRPPGKIVGAVVGGAVLTLLNLAALYFTAVSWLITPDGSWDDDVLSGVTAAAAIGTCLALFTTLITIIPVKARWLTKWWLLVPAVLFVLATARLVQLAVTYPDLPDSYGLGK
jgi:hypothetical protein